MCRGRSKRFTFRAYGSTGASQRLLAVCGYWLDQKGAACQLLLPASARSLHVHTARPSGQCRYTPHLVRLALKRGRPRVVWGANWYTLRQP